MKDKYLILFFVFLLSCDDSFTHTTTTQASKSIIDSKKNRTLVFKCKVDSFSLNNNFINEAWVEKVWSYNREVKGGDIVFNGFYQICFNLKQSDNFFSISNIEKWRILNKSTGKGVYIKSDIYVCRLKNSYPIKEDLGFDLYQVYYENNKIKKRKLGILKFDILK